MKPRFAATSWSEDATPKVAALARAEGTLEIAFRRRGEATVLDHLYQQGCAKARFPKVEASSFTTAVTLNTSGGLTDGDRLSTLVRWGAGTAATAACNSNTPTACEGEATQAASFSRKASHRRVSFIELRYPAQPQ